MAINLRAPCSSPNYQPGPRHDVAPKSRRRCSGGKRRKEAWRYCSPTCPPGPRHDVAPKSRRRCSEGKRRKEAWRYCSPTCPPGPRHDVAPKSRRRCSGSSQRWKDGKLAIAMRRMACSTPLAVCFWPCTQPRVKICSGSW
jgi:hypothetical protein